MKKSSGGELETTTLRVPSMAATRRVTKVLALHHFLEHSVLIQELQEVADLERDPVQYVEVHPEEENILKSVLPRWPSQRCLNDGHQVGGHHAWSCKTLFTLAVKSWRCLLTTAAVLQKGTPYEGGRFKFTIDFPLEYVRLANGLMLSQSRVCTDTHRPCTSSLSKLQSYVLSYVFQTMPEFDFVLLDRSNLYAYAA